MIINIIQTIYGVIFIYLLGFSIILLLFQKQKMNFFLISTISFVLGSCVLSILLLALALLHCLNWAIPLAIFLAVLCILFCYKKIFKDRAIDLRVDYQTVVAGVFIVILGSIIIFPSLFSPILIWDARAMWLVKAKTFFVDNGFPNSFFNTIRYSHKDYPLGFSLLMAFFFRIYGSVNERTLKLYLFLYFINLMTLMIGFLRYSFKKISSIFIVCFVLALFLTREFILHSVSGYADLPLSLAFSSTIALFILAMGIKNKRSSLKYIFIGFLCAIFGVNLKNEGLSFLFIYMVLAFLFVLRKYKYKKIISCSKSNSRTIISYLIISGIYLFPIMIWMYVKNHLGFGNDLFSNGNFLTLKEYILRCLVIITNCIQILSNVPLWGILVVPFVIVNLSMIFTYLVKKRGEFLISIPGIAIFIQGTVYLILYLFTPHDLEWHLATSLDRLFLHLVPSFYIIGIYYLGIIFSNLQLKGSSN